MTYDRFIGPLALAGVSMACTGQAADRAPAREAPGSAIAMDEIARDAAPGTGGPVANLPWARGLSFSSLDEYLAHLETNGAVDLPYYRETRPGVYQLVTTMRPAAEPETFTRDELMRRFGFDR